MFDVKIPEKKLKELKAVSFQDYIGQLRLLKTEGRLLQIPLEDIGGFFYSKEVAEYDGIVFRKLEFKQKLKVDENGSINFRPSAMKLMGK